MKPLLCFPFLTHPSVVLPNSLISWYSANFSLHFGCIHRNRNTVSVLNVCLALMERDPAVLRRLIYYVIFTCIKPCFDILQKSSPLFLQRFIQNRLFQSSFTVISGKVMVTDANRVQFCCKASLKKQQCHCSAEARSVLTQFGLLTV